MGAIDCHNESFQAHQRARQASPRGVAAGLESEKQARSVGWVTILTVKQATIRYCVSCRTSKEPSSNDSDRVTGDCSPWMIIEIYCSLQFDVEQNVNEWPMSRLRWMKMIRPYLGNDRTCGNPIIGPIGLEFGIFTRAMSAMTMLNSCLVTCYYAKKSSSNYIYASLGTTPGDLRDQIHTKVKSMLEVNWGERDAIHPNSALIMISASEDKALPLKMHWEVDKFHNRHARIQQVQWWLTYDQRPMYSRQ